MSPPVFSPEALSTGWEGVPKRGVPWVWEHQSIHSLIHLLYETQTVLGIPLGGEGRASASQPGAEAAKSKHNRRAVDCCGTRGLLGTICTGRIPESLLGKVRSKPR